MRSAAARVAAIARPLGERDVALALALGAFACVVYVVSTTGHTTPFDYFGRLAVAMTFGRVWLDGAPPHLMELVPGVGGHRYHEVPPLVALLLVPITSFGTTGQIQTWLSAVLGGVSAAPVFLALRALGVPRALSMWCVVLSTFATTLWVSAVDGRSWFASDAAGVLFGAVALWLAASGRSPVLVGAALGVAALARTPVALAAPGLLLLARPPGEPLARLARRTIGLVLGAFPFAAIQAGYNALRFGDPFQMGYGLRPNDPFLTRGLFSPTYIPRHIYAIFFEPPFFVDDHPLFLRARGWGMSLFATTPAFLWLARALVVGRSAPHAGPLALAAGLVLLPNLLFGTAGFEQYGYRRALDAQPFLIALVAIGAGWTGTVWLRSGTVLFRAAVVLGVAITLYFLVVIRLYGFLPTLQTR